MSLSTLDPYPVAVDVTEGHAVVNVLAPFPRTIGLVGDELVSAARDHAREWEEFAVTLEGLLRSGWRLQEQTSLYATRRATARGLAALIDADLEHGAVVEWCVTDDRGGFVAIGGALAGYPMSERTFPGATLPALVVNALTGAQRIADDEPALRKVVCGELRACAAWWREHPQERSDHDTHELPEELDELAGVIAAGPVPACVEDLGVGALSTFRGAPHTRVDVRPVSAVIFTGLMDAAGHHSTLTSMPRDGLAEALRRRGAAVARKLGAAVRTV